MRTVSVTGSVEWEVVPDQIVWTISLTDADRDLGAAKAMSDANVRSVLALQQKLGIQDGDIETGFVQIKREYKRDRFNNPEEFKHFVVSRDVTIRQRDLDRFDEFFESIIASADMEVTFRLESSRLQEVRADMRVQAMKAAMEKAAAMAGAVGATLGKVVTIDERAPVRRAPYPFNVSVAAGAPSPDLASATFVPGAIKESVMVYTTFELE